MSKVTKSITINAPVEKVFAFMLVPENLPEIWSSMIEVKNTKVNSTGGFDFGWVYKMGGLKFDGESKTTEMIRNKRLVTESNKGIHSKFVWSYESAKEQTLLTVEVEYTIPIPLINKLAESFIAKTNESEAEAILHNLKSRMEM
jgi:uncharacterized membrane protein